MVNEHQQPVLVGPYVLRKVVGKGLTGIVYDGFHYKTMEKVAVKVLDKTRMTRDSAQRVEREIIILKLLNHPHVVNLKNIFESKKKLFIIMENVSGGELFDYIQKNKNYDAPTREIQQLFYQMVTAVSFCHDHHVCHRDLKPENLLLDERTSIKVADFGLASVQGDNDLLTTSCGSPHYASPEVVSGNKYDGRKADIWSCGVVLFALLNNRMPFEDQNTKMLLEKIKKGIFRMPERVPESVRPLITGMLTVDPEKRMTMDQVRNHPWVRSGECPCCRDYHDEAVQMRELTSPDQLDENVVQAMSNFGCFNKREDVVHALLKPEPNLERICYFLMLKWNAEHRADPAEEKVQASLWKSPDEMPRKRGDNPMYSYHHSSDDKEVKIPTRNRAHTTHGSETRGRDPMSSLRSTTPPPSLNSSNTTSPKGPTTPKKSALQTPPQSNKGCGVSVLITKDSSSDSSPHTVRRSFLRHFIPHTKQEPYFITQLGRSFNEVKTAINLTFFSMRHVSVHDETKDIMRVEYRNREAIFQKRVTFRVSLVEIETDCGGQLSTLSTNYDLPAMPHDFRALHAYSKTPILVKVKFIDGSSRRFKKCCRLLSFALSQPVQERGVCISSRIAAMNLSETESEDDDSTRHAAAMPRNIAALMSQHPTLSPVPCSPPEY